MGIGLKICGVVHPDDAAHCVALGVDAVGINFWSGSRRGVSLDEARVIRAALPRGGPQVIGVFVDADPAWVAKVAQELDLDAVQPHGDRGPEPYAALGVPWIYVVRGPVDLDSLSVPEPLPQWVLLDALTHGYGGRGASLDPVWAADAVARLRARAPSCPVWLAGGLRPDNADAAVAATGVAGIDVASGGEAPAVAGMRPRKDPGKIAALARVCRMASTTSTDSSPASASAESSSASPPQAAAKGALQFGDYGGRYVAETLMPAVAELGEAWREATDDPAFWDEVGRILRDYSGRPTPLTPAPRLAEALGCTGRILLKREDLGHTGSHKINNCVGQILLARRMGKTRIIAETGAGQHGVATATVCAYFGLPCVVYMGATDVERQALNVFRMRLLGAEVRPVTAGSATLKDAINEALRDWVANVDSTHYVIGSVMGPDPYPTMVRDLQRVIGDEARAQVLAQHGELPDSVLACVGGGSNAIGIFTAFVPHEEVALVGAEAAGEGLAGRHAATMARGEVGIYHGMKSLVLQDRNGQLQEAHSISAGLDYPGVGPEHAMLRDRGRARYESVTDDEALAALSQLARTEGIIAALETAHALALLPRLIAENPAQTILVNVSGRGDKDMHTLMERGLLGDPAASGTGDDPHGGTDA